MYDAPDHAGGVPAVRVTERAFEHLARLTAQDPRFLRLSVMPGGCAGLSYSACLDDRLGGSDLVMFEREGIRVVAHSTSAPLVHGLEIDYSDDLVRSGFRFRNPNAKHACGCGQSFKARAG